MAIDREHLHELINLLDRRAPGVIVRVTRDRAAADTVYINLIDVPKSQRGFGMGQRVLDLICQTADARGWDLKLSATSELGSDLTRLVNWYWRAGFAPVPGGAATTMKRRARTFAHA